MPHIEELRFRAGELTLAATLTRPEADGRLPWVLLVPSWLPRDRDGGWDRGGHPTWFAPSRPGGRPALFIRLADALAERGVASLRYDPRGCGESDGSWELSGLFSRIDDARDAIGAMRSRGDLDLRRTAIVGHGEGAAVALSVAIGDPAIAAVATIGASARSYRDVLRRAVAERDRTGTDRMHPFVATLDRHAEELIERVGRREPTISVDVGATAVELSLDKWEQAFHTPPMALATMLHRNVVLAHGSDDVWSDADESQLLARVLADAGNDPKLHVIEGAGHDLEEADDAAIQVVAASIAARIEPRDLPPVLLAIENMG